MRDRLVLRMRNAPLVAGLLGSLPVVTRGFLEVCALKSAVGAEALWGGVNAPRWLGEMAGRYWADARARASRERDSRRTPRW